MLNGISSVPSAVTLISKSLTTGLKEVFRGLTHKEAKLRTDEDLPMGWVMLGAAVALTIVAWAIGLAVGG